MTDFYSTFSEKELAILAARASRVERAVHIEQGEHRIDVLTVNIHDEVYALPVASILGVYEDVAITMLPGTPPFIAGVANVRGHLLTVLNLAAVLDIPGQQGEKNAVVVATSGTVQVGLLVDAAAEVITIIQSKITPVARFNDNQQQAHLEGLLPDGTAFLDIDAILNDPGLVVDQS